MDIPYAEINVPSVQTLKNYYKNTVGCNRHLIFQEGLCACQKVAHLKRWINKEMTKIFIRNKFICYKKYLIFNEY